MDHRLRARRATERGIPAELPAEEVERLPFVGTSWYTRGWSYWLRRGLLTVLFLGVLVMGLVFEWAIFSIGSDFRTPLSRRIWYVLFSLLLAASFVRPTQVALAQRRRVKAGQLVHLGATNKRRSAAGGAGIGYLATTGSVAAGAFLFIGVIFFFGWFVFMFIWTLTPEVGLEHDARLRLQRRHPRTPTGEALPGRA